jgi:hypothetical protein
MTVPSRLDSPGGRTPRGSLPGTDLSRRARFGSGAGKPRRYGPLWTALRWASVTDVLPTAVPLAAQVFKAGAVVPLTQYMRRIATVAPLVAAVVLALAAPATASHLAIAYDDGTPAPLLQALVDQAKVPMPPGPVVAHRSNCPDDWFTCASPPDIYGVGNDRHALFHELGHVFDYEVMTDAARSALQDALDDHRPWWTPTTEHPYPGQEVSAEAYSWCAMRGRYLTRPVVNSAYAYHPGPKRFRRACRVFRMADAGVYGQAARGGF